MPDNDPAQAEIKLCKDCKYFRPYASLSRENAAKYAECGRTVSLVTGDPEEFCSQERQYSDTGCGPGARFYQARVRD